MSQVLGSKRSLNNYLKQYRNAREIVKAFYIRLSLQCFCSVAVAITWSQHQYQRHPTLDCRRSPGHGLSPVTASRKILNASLRGNPHVLLGFRMEGMASIYFSFRLLYPPILWKPAEDLSVKSKRAGLGERKKNGWFNSLTYWFLLKRMSPASWPLFGRCLYTSPLLVPLKKGNSRISGHDQSTCLLDKQNDPGPSP